MLQRKEMANSVKKKSPTAQVGDFFLCCGNLVRLRGLCSASLQNQGFPALATVVLAFDIGHDGIVKDPSQDAQQDIVLSMKLAFHLNRYFDGKMMLHLSSLLYLRSASSKNSRVFSLSKLNVSKERLCSSYGS